MALSEHGRPGNTANRDISASMGGLAKPPVEEVIDGCIGGSRETFDALTRDLERASIPLSGGFDSGTSPRWPRSGSS